MLEKMLRFCACVWTETSAGLQRILQEIQPKDTNDFFTSARELDAHHGDDTQTAHTPAVNAGELQTTVLMIFNIPQKSIMPDTADINKPKLHIETN